MILGYFENADAKKHLLLDLDIEMRNLLGWDEYMYKDKYPYKLPIIEKVAIDTKASVADKGNYPDWWTESYPCRFGPASR